MFIGEFEPLIGWRICHCGTTTRLHTASVCSIWLLKPITVMCNFKFCFDKKGPLVSGHVSTDTANRLACAVEVRRFYSNTNPGARRFSQSLSGLIPLATCCRAERTPQHSAGRGTAYSGPRRTLGATRRSRLQHPRGRPP